MGLFLAAQSGRAIGRDHLAAMLWGDLPERAARRAMSTSLTRLRQLWPLWPVTGEGEVLWWDPSHGVETDLELFTRQMHGGDPEGALFHRRGPLLDGWSLVAGAPFEAWQREMRELWERRVVEAWDLLARAHAGHGDWDGLCRAAQAALAVDPVQERFHRWLIEALARRGDRAAALAQYEACCRVLRAELGVAPGAETLALREAVAAGVLPHTPPPCATPLVEMAGPPPRVGAAAAGRAGEPQTDSEAGAPPGRSRPAPPPQPALIGRRHELHRIEEALADRAASGARIVLLHGEAGSGKTRLVQEMLWRRRSAGGPTLVGHCYETTYGLPYAPFVEALEGADVSGLPLPAAWLAPLAKLLPDAGLPAPEATPSPEEERGHLWRAVARLLQSLPQPALLVLEDLHWADEASCMLLAHLARRLAGEGVALLVTARTGELSEALDRQLGNLQREGRALRMELGALSREETMTLAQAVAGRRGFTLGERIYAETRGNALYVVELARAAAEGMELGGDGVGVGALPPGVRAAVADRVARLPAAASEMLAAACIFATGAPFRLLRAVSRLPEREALAAQDALVRVGLLQESAGDRVEFGHGLVRHAVAEGLTRSRRSVLHGRAYRALVAGGEAAPEALATHAAAAGLWGPAVRWRREAAEAALGVGAHPVAAWHMEEALAHLSRLRPTPARENLAAALRGRQEQLGHWSDPRSQRHARLPETATPAAAGARLHQAEILFMQGHARQALTVLEAMIPEVGAHAGSTLHVYTLAGVAICQLVLGEYWQAAATFGEATQRAGGSLRQLNGLTADGALAGAWACLGEFALAEEALAALDRQARSDPQPALASNLLGVRAQVACLRGDWTQAAACSRDGAELARAAQHRYNEYFASIWLGPALLYSRDVRGGLDALATSVRLARQARTRILLDWVCALLAEARLHAGEPEAAAAAARMGLRLARRNGYRHGAALCTRSLGLSAAAIGETGTARGHFADALRQLRSLGARPHLAACHADLAELAASAAEREGHRRQAGALRRRMRLAPEPPLPLHPAGSWPTHHA